MIRFQSRPFLSKEREGVEDAPSSRLDYIGLKLQPRRERKGKEGLVARSVFLGKERQGEKEDKTASWKNHFAPS